MVERMTKPPAPSPRRAVAGSAVDSSFQPTRCSAVVEKTSLSASGFSSGGLGFIT